MQSGLSRVNGGGGGGGGGGPQGRMIQGFNKKRYRVSQNPWLLYAYFQRSVNM